MQVGQPSNILTELGMSSDAYNWAATVQGVSSFQDSQGLPPANSTDTLYHFRTTQQSRTQIYDTAHLGGSHLPNMGHRNSLLRSSKDIRSTAGLPFSSRYVRSRHVPRRNHNALILVSNGRGRPAYAMVLLDRKPSNHHRIPNLLRGKFYGRHSRPQWLALGIHPRRPRNDSFRWCNLLHLT